MDHLDTLHQAQSAASNACKIVSNLLFNPPLSLNDVDVAVFNRTATAANAIADLDTRAISHLARRDVLGPTDASAAVAALEALNSAVVAIAVCKVKASSTIQSPQRSAALTAALEALTDAKSKLQDFIISNKLLDN